jgi:hypothetical protein
MTLTILKGRETPRGWHPTRGRGFVLDPDLREFYDRKGFIRTRDAAAETDWVENALLDEGEQDVLNVWLLQTSDLSKYLCLLKGTAPAETDTLTFLAGGTNGEAQTPAANGYNRIIIANTDWGTPALNSGDYQTTAAGKTFGPASGSNWASMTGAGLVTHLTSQSAGSGKFLIYLALSGTTTVNIGQSFLYQLSAKAQ